MMAPSAGQQPAGRHGGKTEKAAADWLNVCPPCQETPVAAGPLCAWPVQIPGFQMQRPSNPHTPTFQTTPRLFNPPISSTQACSHPPHPTWKKEMGGRACCAAGWMSRASSSSSPSPCCCRSAATSSGSRRNLPSKMPSRGGAAAADSDRSTTTEPFCRAPRRGGRVRCEGLRGVGRVCAGWAELRHVCGAAATTGGEAHRVQGSTGGGQSAPAWAGARGGGTRRTGRIWEGLFRVSFHSEINLHSYLTSCCGSGCSRAGAACVFALAPRCWLPAQQITLLR